MNSRRLLPGPARVAKGLVFMKIIATFPASGFRLSLERSLTSDAFVSARRDAGPENASVREAGDGAEFLPNVSVREAGDGAEFLPNASVREAGDGAELAAYSYRGDLHFADRVEPAACTVFADGSVRVDVAPSELHEKVRLLVRAAIKGPLREGLAPPRRIQRWRDGA